MFWPRKIFFVRLLFSIIPNYQKMQKIISGKHFPPKQTEHKREKRKMVKWGNSCDSVFREIVHLSVSDFPRKMPRGMLEVLVGAKGLENTDFLSEFSFRICFFWFLSFDLLPHDLSPSNCWLCITVEKSRNLLNID